ncbi:hypothetical protein RXV86_17565 [Alisedimentitalea sp. MJ-SS2]|uniref:hypothetical protein n=1 Tax=Aliisedimentitalea sp. MJ-SS2 TaxID=3049795 RepID=UPI00290F63AF|nr:hypothetical protein [Alisedimentitalea sp. MJ-SS2]MDU8929205.1 hypothetical protein [Alisedimentitalea sp. MJ-SS2]
MVKNLRKNWAETTVCHAVCDRLSRGIAENGGYAEIAIMECFLGASGAFGADFGQSGP